MKLDTINHDIKNFSGKKSPRVREKMKRERERERQMPKSL